MVLLHLRNIYLHWLFSCSPFFRCTHIFRKINTIRYQLELDTIKNNATRRKCECSMKIYSSNMNNVIIVLIFIISLKKRLLFLSNITVLQKIHNKNIIAELHNYIEKNYINQLLKHNVLMELKYINSFLLLVWSVYIKFISFDVIVKYWWIQFIIYNNTPKTRKCWFFSWNN